MSAGSLCILAVRADLPLLGRTSAMFKAIFTAGKMELHASLSLQALTRLHVHLLIHSFTELSLNTCSVPGPVLGTRTPEVK